jgi:hypothetical protein
MGCAARCEGGALFRQLSRGTLRHRACQITESNGSEAFWLSTRLKR